MDTDWLKAEADPKVNFHWYQAQDFSGTLGEDEVWELESQNTAILARPLVGGKEDFYLMTWVQPHNSSPCWMAQSHIQEDSGQDVVSIEPLAKASPYQQEVGSESHGNVG